MEKRQRNISLISYAIWLVLFVVAVVYTITKGTELERVEHHQGVSTLGDAWGVFSSSVEHHMGGTIGLLLLQILVILFFARLVGWLFRKAGQPAVIGEICAGIMLGPSLLGRIAPEAFGWLFPSSSLGTIQLLSNFGLILFMFVVGMELRLSDIKKRFVPSLVISHVGMFFPFILSLPVSYWIYQDYSSAETPFIAFALFIGIALCITAFPVLARIIQEQGLQRQPLGKLALSTAASGDITAWLLLAGIIAISQSGSMMSMLYNFLFLLLYLAVMFGIIRPMFAIAGKVYDNTEVISHALIGGIFILLILSSWITELLSMHALFGAFMLGLVMPEDVSFRKILTDKVEDVSLMLFLPLFFVSSGLQTELSLIDGQEMWLLLGVLTLIAVVGKVGGTYLSARVTGEKVRSSLFLGALMNTRGLMELVVLAIGLDLGILSPRLYVILVLMTVITTVMTMPMIQVMQRVFAFIDRRRERKHQLSTENFKVLISFGRPNTGVLLTQLSAGLLRRGEALPQMTALHITTDTSLTMVEADKYYLDNFSPLLREAEQRGYNLNAEHLFSEHVEHTVVEKLRRERYNLLLIGAGLRLAGHGQDEQANEQQENFRKKIGGAPLSLTEQMLSIHTLLRDKMDYFVRTAPCSVGVLLNRGYQTPSHIYLRLTEQDDIKLLSYARALTANSKAKLSLFITQQSTLVPEEIPLHEGESLAYEQAMGEVLEGADLMMLSYAEWQRVYDKDVTLMKAIPSTLIFSIKSLQ